MGEAGLERREAAAVGASTMAKARVVGTTEEAARVPGGAAAAVRAAEATVAVV